jgi:hypothetical protein
MRLKLIRCFICSDWYSPKRNHCPTCSAAKVVLSSGNVFHIDTSTGRVIGSGLSRYQFGAHALRIAQELMKGY